MPPCSPRSTTALTVSEPGSLPWKGRVCVVGAGSFGTAVATIAAKTVFPEWIWLWARQPELSERIERERENKQYLPGVTMPDNVRVSSNLKEAAQNATAIIVAVPQQYMTTDMLQEIANVCGEESSDTVHVVCLTQGLVFSEGQLKRSSEIAWEGLRMACPKRSFEVSVLIGANVIDQMNINSCAEATLGCASANQALHSLVHDPERLSVTMTVDSVGVELSEALKSIIALAAGYCEDLGLGSNIKAAVIRRGLVETMRFIKAFFPEVHDETMLVSCSISDLMMSCFGGQGKGPESTRSEQSDALEDLECGTMNGQELPVWHNAQAIYKFLEEKKQQESFPLFAAVYRIRFEKAPPESIVDVMKSPTCTPAEPVLNISFRGRRALVTGAANGIGQCIARVLASYGARVTLLDRDRKGLKKLQNELHCDAIEVDLMDTAAVQTKLNELSDEPPQLLVNCAGISKFQPFFETNLEAFDQMYAVNTRASIQITQAISRKLVDAKLTGSIVHISSQASTLAMRDQLVYSSSKAALDQIARIQALELGPFNIRVNVVRPTVVMTTSALQNWKTDDLKELRESIPLGRLPQPLDVARTVCWLLSDQSSLVTGQAIAVDGGPSMGGFGM